MHVLSHLLLSLLWFFVAYSVVTIVGIGHTVFNWKVLKMEDEGKEIHTFRDVSSYAATIPYHWLYNVVLFPPFAWLYFRQIQPESLWSEAWQTGLLWLALALIVDLVGWVWIRHPWRCTWREFYIDYQPWLSIIYVAIAISPLLAACFM